MKMTKMWNDRYDHRRQNNIKDIDLLEDALTVIQQEILPVKDAELISDDDVSDLLDFYDNIEELMENIYNKFSSRNFSNDETGEEERRTLNQMRKDYLEFITLSNEVPVTTQEWNKYYRSMYDILDDFFDNASQM